MKARVQKLFGLTETKLDAIVIATAIYPSVDGSFFWLFDVPTAVFEESVAVAHPDGELDVYAPVLEAGAANAAAKKDSHVTVHGYRSPTELENALKATLGSAKKIGLNYPGVTAANYTRLKDLLPGSTFVDVGNAMRKARLTKDAQEIERIQKAAGIGSKVALEIPGQLKEGMAEPALAREITYRLMVHGADGPSFPTVVGFGPNSAEPHYFPFHLAGPRTLRSGDSIVCDFGAYFGRYASDITRSFHFGRRDEELKRVHEKVEEAQQAALAVISPGVLAKDVHLAAQRVVDASPWKGRFMHVLGHSVGLSVHDGWWLDIGVDDPLEENMVMTVEPGIYLPGHGGVRIEDDVVVTRTGYRFLTTAPRGYIEVPA